MSSPDRKPKRLLTAEQKYDLWVRMLAGQVTQAEAAAEAGVDRSVISRLRAVARDGAIAQISRPGTEAANYYERCLARGKTKREALRNLKRRISDRVWTHLNTQNLT
ncbi:MAG: hypothetical protein OXB99_14595 [Acidimicrobiaceae bacterium]|nr:hypothetical protein [Acidimicrobiaceae bacterium]